MGNICANCDGEITNREIIIGDPQGVTSNPETRRRENNNSIALDSKGGRNRSQFQSG